MSIKNKDTIIHNLKKKINILIKQYNNDRKNKELYEETLHIKKKILSLKENMDIKKEEKVLNILENETNTLNKLVLHKKNGCKPCERLHKIWPNLLKYIDDKKFKIKIIEKYKTQTDGILTYPTIKLYLNNGKMIIYDKDKYPRTTENLIKFIQKYSQFFI